jgi:hypothetical protein
VTIIIAEVLVSPTTFISIPGKCVTLNTFALNRFESLCEDNMLDEDVPRILLPFTPRL